MSEFDLFKTFYTFAKKKEVMTTITLEYNSRAKSVQNILDGLLALGVLKVKSDEVETYNPEFVKMIKEADAAPKKAMSLDEIKERLGV